MNAAPISRPEPSAQLTRADGELVIRLEGEFDIATRNLIDGALAEAAEVPEVRIVVDLSGVGFMDGAGMHALLDGRERLAACGRVLRTRRAQPQVARLLEIARAQYGILI